MRWLHSPIVTKFRQSLSNGLQVLVDVVKKISWPKSRGLGRKVDLVILHSKRGCRVNLLSRNSSERESLRNRPALGAEGLEGLLNLPISEANTIVGSTDQESSQQLRTWVSEHFSRQNVLRNLSLVRFLLGPFSAGRNFPRGMIFSFVFWRPLSAKWSLNKENVAPRGKFLLVENGLYSATNMARKMSKKPCSIPLLRWFNFSQSENRKNNRKIFERASMEPTNQGTSVRVYYFGTFCFR